MSSSTSQEVRAGRIATRIVHLRVSPRTIRRHGRLTVSGELERRTRSWRPFAHQRVIIVVKPRGKHTWYRVYKIRTNSRGRFRKRFTYPLRRSGRWSVDYNGNRDHLVCGGAVDEVRYK